MSPRDSILYYKHFLQTGMMAMEPQTGYVKAWVGGINYKHFQYDHVGQGARQVGSTFKPFLYATAIEQLKMSPCHSIYDSPFTMPKGRYGIDADWSPKNSTGNYRGIVNLKSALANSINTVSAKLIDKVGPEAVVDITRPKKALRRKYRCSLPSLWSGRYYRRNRWWPLSVRLPIREFT